MWQKCGLWPLLWTRDFLINSQSFRPVSLRRISRQILTSTKSKVQLLLSVTIPTRISASRLPPHPSTAFVLGNDAVRLVLKYLLKSTFIVSTWTRVVRKVKGRNMQIIGMKTKNVFIFPDVRRALDVWIVLIINSFFKSVFKCLWDMLPVRRSVCHSWPACAIRYAEASRGTTTQTLAAPH